MRHVLLGFAFILIADIVYSDHITVQGEVSGSWNTDTVMVAGDLIIPDGETLQIYPGTLVEFQGSYLVTVKGAVNATGSANDSIHFRIADTTGFHADTIPGGGWRGIRLDNIRTSNETSVFYRCGPAVAPWGNGGRGTFSGAFENCLDENPDFLGYGPFPYSIPVNSPSFNAGTPDNTGLMLPATDLEHNPRFELSAIDIGADEVYPYGVDEDKSPDGRVKVWPNPFSDHVFVEVESGDSENVLIEIMDIQGRKLKETTQEDLVKGKHRFILQMNETGTTGVYLVRISIDNTFLTYKLIKNFSQIYTD
jgi:hypothetical protein